MISTYSLFDNNFYSSCFILLNVFVFFNFKSLCTNFFLQREEAQAYATSAQGIPRIDLNNSLTVGPRGPILLHDVNYIEEIAHFDRERIPERVVHAKGGGAFGYFEVTHDITKYCAAVVFSEIGKKTDVAVRFSTVGGESGSADTVRDPRGFAIKFYTEEGRYIHVFI